MEYRNLALVWYGLSFDASVSLTTSVGTFSPVWFDRETASPITHRLVRYHVEVERLRSFLHPRGASPESLSLRIHAWCETADG